MDQFMQKYGRDVTGILRGFDRLTFRGTARSLAVLPRMEWFLREQKVLLKDWDKDVEQTTAQLKRASCEEAVRLGRPVLYLESSKTSKEDVARSLAKHHGVAEGLIAVLTSVEQCQSYEVFRDRAERKLRLVPRRIASAKWPERTRIAGSFQAFFHKGGILPQPGREKLAEESAAEELENR